MTIFNSISFYLSSQILTENLFCESHCARATGNVLGFISKCNGRISAQLELNKIQLWPRAYQS